MADPFWEHPDWSGGCNLRDPGTSPFWMLPPKKQRHVAPMLPSPMVEFGSAICSPQRYMRPAAQS